jgi:hypothetical protein
MGSGFEPAKYQLVHFTGYPEKDYILSPTTPHATIIASLPYWLFRIQISYKVSSFCIFRSNIRKNERLYLEECLDADLGPAHNLGSGKKAKA